MVRVGGAVDRARAIADLQVSAPDLIILEVFNAVQKRVRRRDVAADQLDGLADILRRVLADLVPAAELTDEACRLARDVDHPVYDCLYLVLARRSAVPLVTADERQFAAARQARIEARLL